MSTTVTPTNSQDQQQPYLDLTLNEALNEDLIATPTRSTRRGGRAAPQDITDILDKHIIEEYKSFQLQFDILIDCGPHCYSEKELSKSFEPPICSTDSIEDSIQHEYFRPTDSIKDPIRREKAENPALNGKKKYSCIDIVSPWVVSEDNFFGLSTSQLPTMTHQLRCSYYTLEKIVEFRRLKHPPTSPLPDFINPLIARLVQDDMSSIDQITQVTCNLLYEWDLKKILTLWRHTMEGSFPRLDTQCPADFVITQAFEAGIITDDHYTALLHRVVDLFSDVDPTIARKTQNPDDIELSIDQNDDGNGTTTISSSMTDEITPNSTPNAFQRAAAIVPLDTTYFEPLSKRLNSYDDEDYALTEETQILNHISDTIKLVSERKIYLSEFDPTFSKKNDLYTTENYYLFPVWEFFSIQATSFMLDEKSELAYLQNMRKGFANLLKSYIPYFKLILERDTTLDNYTKAKDKILVQKRAQVTFVQQNEKKRAIQEERDRKKRQQEEKLQEKEKFKQSKEGNALLKQLDKAALAAQKQQKQLQKTTKTEDKVVSTKSATSTPAKAKAPLKTPGFFSQWAAPKAPQPSASDTTITTSTTTTTADPISLSTTSSLPKPNPFQFDAFDTNIKTTTSTASKSLTTNQFKTKDQPKPFVLRPFKVLYATLMGNRQGTPIVLKYSKESTSHTTPFIPRRGNIRCNYISPKSYLAPNRIIQTHLNQFTKQISQQLCQEYGQNTIIPTLSTTFTDYCRTKYGEKNKKKRAYRALAYKRQVDPTHPDNITPPPMYDQLKRQNCLGGRKDAIGGCSTKVASTCASTTTTHSINSALFDDDLHSIISPSSTNSNGDLSILNETNLASVVQPASHINSKLHNDPVIVGTALYDMANNFRFRSNRLWRTVKCLNFGNNIACPPFLGPWPLFNPVGLRFPVPPQSMTMQDFLDLPKELPCPFAFPFASQFTGASLTNCIPLIYPRKPLYRYPQIAYPKDTELMSGFDDFTEMLDVVAKETAADDDEPYLEFLTAVQELHRTLTEKGLVSVEKDQNDSDDDDSDDESGDDEYENDFVEEGQEAAPMIATLEATVIFGPEKEFNLYKQDPSTDGITNLEKLVEYKKTQQQYQCGILLANTDDLHSFITNSLVDKTILDSTQYTSRQLKRMRLNTVTEPKAEIIQALPKDYPTSTQLSLTQVVQQANHQFVQLDVLQPVIWPTILASSTTPACTPINTLQITLLPTRKRKALPRKHSKSITSSTDVVPLNPSTNTIQIDRSGNAVNIITVKRKPKKVLEAP